jgi:hypothetical protein
VQFHGCAVDAGDATVRFADRGAPALEVGTVISATGFRIDNAWIDRQPGPPAGVTGWPGLCFPGPTWQHPGLGAPGLREDDAENIGRRTAPELPGAPAR